MDDSSGNDELKVPDRVQNGISAEIARQVREERRALSLTQEGLALMAGVGRRFVSEIENEKPSLRLAELIRVLGVLGLHLQVAKSPGGVR